MGMPGAANEAIWRRAVERKRYDPTFAPHAAAGATWVRRSIFGRRSERVPATVLSPKSCRSRPTDSRLYASQVVRDGGRMPPGDGCGRLELAGATSGVR